MKVLVVILGFLVCASAVLEDTCRSKWKTKSDKIDKVFKNDFNFQDNDVKEYILCVYRKIVYIGLDGKFNKTMVVALAAEDDKQELGRAIDGCDEKKTVTAQVAWDIAKCLAKMYYKTKQTKHIDAWTMIGCQDKYPLDHDVYPRIMSGDEFGIPESTIKSQKAFTYCYDLKVGIITEDGKLSKEAFVFDGGRSHYHAKAKNFDRCKNEPGVTAEEKSWNFNKCIERFLHLYV